MPFVPLIVDLNKNLFLSHSKTTLIFLKMFLGSNQINYFTIKWKKLISMKESDNAKLK